MKPILLTFVFFLFFCSQWELWDLVWLTFYVEYFINNIKEQKKKTNRSVYPTDHKCK